ncbi:MAG: DUF2637 domain-containing protein [Micromonosporaceae bacterium]|nr:DUF2637 domain-containing protein [Micromonosporaceae bacterium]
MSAHAPSWPRRLAIGSVLVVAVTVFALSFDAITEVAVRVGAVNARMRWLVPIAIDGGIIAGCATLWAQALEGRHSWRSRLFVALLLGLSVWVNVEHAASGPGGLLARVIAGSPPVILFGALELVADQFLRSARTHGRDVTAGTGAVPAGTPPHMEPAVDPERLVEPPDDLPVTERARHTLAAYLDGGGDSSDRGLAAAIAERTGCHPRTAYRVIQQRLSASSAHAQDNGDAEARADPARVG